VARINIEDELFRDSRFLWLSDVLGSSTKALGMLVQFWMAAQRRWGRGELLPDIEFLPMWQPLLEVGFAERRCNGVYAKGSEQQFAWYRAEIEKTSRAGLASAKARKKKFGTAVPTNATNRTQSEPEPNPVFGKSEPEPNPPTPTPTPTPTLKEVATTTNASDFFVQLVGGYSGAPLHAKTSLVLSPRQTVLANKLLAQKPNPEYWTEVMQRAAASDFLCGRTQQRFVFRLAFLLQPTTHERIMSGEYDNSEAPAKVVQKWFYEDEHANR